VKMLNKKKFFAAFCNFVQDIFITFLPNCRLLKLRPVIKFVNLERTRE
jgi:hypothetical protein